MRSIIISHIINTVLIILIILLLNKNQVLHEESFTLQQQLDVAHYQIQNVGEAYENLRNEITLLKAEEMRSAARSSACIDKLEELQRYEQTLIGPKPRVSIANLTLSKDSAIINVDNLIPGIIAPTQSMSPTLEEDMIVLEKRPLSSSEIAVGDIIVYEFKGSRIIHRVIALGEDDIGWYAILKGDNNPAPDPQKVRFEQVRGIVVGIIY